MSFTRRILEVVLAFSMSQDPLSARRLLFLRAAGFQYFRDPRQAHTKRRSAPQSRSLGRHVCGGLSGYLHDESEARSVGNVPCSSFGASPEHFKYLLEVFPRNSHSAVDHIQAAAPNSGTISADFWNLEENSAPHFRGDWQAARDRGAVDGNIGIAPLFHYDSAALFFVQVAVFRENFLEKSAAC